MLLSYDERNADRMVQLFSIISSASFVIAACLNAFAFNTYHAFLIQVRYDRNGFGCVLFKVEDDCRIVECGCA